MCFYFSPNTVSDEADVLIVCGCIVTAATEVMFYPVFVKYGKRSFAVSGPILWNTLPLRESWKSASVFNAHLVDDPTIQQPGFALPRQQWSLLNRLRTGQGHCGACKMKWKLSDSDQCSCGETQTMSHIVEYCPQTRLHSGLSKLHSADDDAVVWLTSYGS